MGAATGLKDLKTESTISTISCWFYEFREPIATLIAALAAAVVAPWVGLSIYHRQKEYEIVRKRYLDNGLDIISNSAEYALGVYRHNWARSLTALKHFRDFGCDMPKVLYESGYVELEPTSFNTTHTFILSELVEDSIFSEAQQFLYSFVTNSNALFIYDLCSTVRLSVEGSKEIELTAKRETIVEEYFKRLYELNKECAKYYTLLQALYELSATLSRQRLDFKTVERFKEQPMVKGRIKRLKELFAEKLSELP